MVKRKPFLEAAKILGYIVFCLLAGIIGGLFTTTGPDSWYSNLIKPSFNPPSWIFAPVWTTLYIMMGIALYLAVKNKTKILGKTLFITQLILNTLWAVLFFGFETPFWAFIEILLLWFVILWTMIEFYKKSKVATYWLIPYLLWVSFATILNLTIYILN
jgi:tryptophan-rich sensory protein